MLPKQIAQINREPRKMNVNPKWPAPDRVGDSMTNWDIPDNHRGRKYSLGHIPKAEWERIFGKDATS